MDNKIKISCDTQEFDDAIETQIEKVENFKIGRRALGIAGALGAGAFFTWSFDQSINNEGEFKDSSAALKATLGVLSLVGVGCAGYLVSAFTSDIVDICEERAERKSVTNIKRIQLQKNQYITDCINKKIEEIKAFRKEEDQIEEVVETKKKLKKR